MTTDNTTSHNRLHCKRKSLQQTYRGLKCDLSFKHPAIITSCVNSGFGAIASDRIQKVKIYLCNYTRRSCCTAIEVYRSPGTQLGPIHSVQDTCTGANEVCSFFKNTRSTYALHQDYFWPPRQKWAFIPQKRGKPSSR